MIPQGEGTSQICSNLNVLWVYPLSCPLGSWVYFRDHYFCANGLVSYSWAPCSIYSWGQAQIVNHAQWYLLMADQAWFQRLWSPADLTLSLVISLTIKLSANYSHFLNLTTFFFSQWILTFFQDSMKHNKIFQWGICDLVMLPGSLIL